MSGRVKVSRLVDVSAPYHGVCIVRLSDGATLRARESIVREFITGRPVDARFIAYTVDDSGNRHSPRVATDGEREAARAGWLESPRNSGAELERGRDPRFADIPRRAPGER